MKSFLNTLQRCYSTSISKTKVTLFPGHGIGPEISNSVMKILDVAGSDIEWDIQPIGTSPDKDGNIISKEALQSLKNNKIALKGPLATPIGKGYKSLNLTLRQEFGLYANVRPAVNIPYIKTPFNDVDLVTIRENTEGEYCGLEHRVVPGVVESIKVITEKASTKIAEYAFKYARDNDRYKVTAVHKANIMKMSDGLFLECCRKVAERYPDIEYEEMIVDACCMKLVRDPSSFDVLLTPNLYGDIISDLTSGLVGGLGVTGSANYGDNIALFEAVHGTAPDIAGQDKANPTALLLSSLMMLEHMGKTDVSEVIRWAMMKVLKEGKIRTGDLGGRSSCTEYTNEIIKNL